MTGTLEMLFSVYLVPFPPFLARLKADEINLSDRIKLLRYRKSTGETVKYCLLTVKARPKVYQNAAMRSIQFAKPDHGFLSFLMLEDTSDLPYVGWPSRKNSGPFVTMGGYEWHWEDDGMRLVAYDGLASFTLETEEAKALARVMDAQ